MIRLKHPFSCHSASYRVKQLGVIAEIILTVVPFGDGKPDPGDVGGVGDAPACSWELGGQKGPRWTDSDPPVTAGPDRDDRELSSGLYSSTGRQRGHVHGAGEEPGSVPLPVLRAEAGGRNETSLFGEFLGDLQRRNTRRVCFPSCT